MEPVSVVRGYSMGSGASKTVDGSGKKSSSRSRKSGPAYYNPATFTITAYLPYDGGKRLKLQCTPGQTVQQVIETGIPEFSSTSYQVYQFPSRALLNPEKDASVLQDQEISIEPMRSSSPDIGDDRLSIARELLKTEDTYLENLRNIFDVYMEPLKKWGLPQSEMNTMFRSLSRLCDLLMNFFSELEIAVQRWSANTTKIGGLFKQYRSFWDMYKEFSNSYTVACKLLKDKRQMDDSFNSFLELRRGAAMHTLESLMLLPVQRIYEYHKLLVQLFKITPKEHPDYSDLRYAVTCVISVVQEREQQLVRSQNKSNLQQVQSRFPNDNLKLLEREGLERRSKSINYPRLTSHSTPKSRGSEVILESVDGPSTVRLYLTEGPVRIISGMHTHERFFFLFDDLLIIAKPIRKQKSQHKTYKRKEQLRLSDMWVTDCISEVMESTLPADTAFVIGWPMTNCMAAFSTPEEKILWYNQLSKNIASQRNTVKPDSISVQIVNLTKSSNPIPVWVEVAAGDTAGTVLLKALDLFAIAVASSNCQLWVKFSKDDAALPLIGHEHPFAIQMCHNRQQMDYMGDAKPIQLQFVIKRKSAISNGPSQGLKKQKFSLRQLIKKGKRTPGPPKKKMFKVPLETIIVNNQMPEILQEMLIRLYTEAPQTLGIFRQSANYRKVKDIKEALDNGERVDLTNVSIHVIGALLKELLRSVPGGVLMSTRYTEFVATNDVKDVTTRVHHLKKVIGKLPEEHQLFLHYLFALLHHIANNEEVNCMNTINLAICFAPSILWPDSGLDVIKNEVPPLVQFIVEHSPKIFGAELPELYKQVAMPGSPGVEAMEFEYEDSPNSSSLVPTKIGDGSQSSHQRSGSVDSSLSEDSLYNKNSLLRSKRNGLTFSDSQLSTISQHDYNPPQRTGSKSRYTSSSHAQPLGAPMNKRVKKVREPKRSSSLQGPSDMSPNSRRFYDRRQFEARRRSLAIQDLPMIKKQEYIPGVQTILDSESQSSSDYNSSHLQSRAPHGSYIYSDRHLAHQHRHDGHRHSSQKKRRLPQHSNSFSKGSENKPVKPMASSTSWYDRLLPLEPDTKMKSRSMGTALGNRLPLSDESRDGDNDQRMRVGSGPIFEDRAKKMYESHSPRFQIAPHPQSVSSSRSGSSTSTVMYHQRQPPPSAISPASGGSQGTADTVAPSESSSYGGKLDKEYLKVAISKRFDISGSQDSTPPSHKVPSTSLSSYYTPISEQEVPNTSTADEQSKPVERKRANSTASIVSEGSFIKSPSYQFFLSSQQKKDSSLMSLTQASLDDRPESDQHLHSLPRPHTAEIVRPEKQMASTILYPPMGTVPQVLQVGPVLETAPYQDPGKLFPSSGYSSDTESSPSRTLNRPDRKILEVTSPGASMPKRYGRIGYHHHGKLLMKAHTIDDPSTAPMQVDMPQAKEPQHVTTTTASVTTKEESLSSEHGKQEQAPPTDTQPKKLRPKSGDGSKIGQLVKTFSRPAIEANNETAKVRMGLIPPMRQRSKSTSEKEAMRIIHQIIEEDESAARTAEEEERAEKHKAWASSAPTTADRKKAWESLSHDKFKRAELRSRSLKHEGIAVVEKAPPKPSMTPEMKRRSATMPEYLVTGPRRVRGGAEDQIRTYKVVLFDSPKPERIRRINLRTFH
ncbi:uncharacterized protein LOC135349721 isoform X2 [Halichondria panicea]|uniref:uncharacterized protein LOC135349721 isoform X2 n=1 Tax=Halichondria panicea TaxID=6063 RepID=UPI00312B8A51